MSLNSTELLLKEVESSFDDCELVAWHPVLANQPVCGCHSQQFARVLSEWFGVQVEVVATPTRIEIQPAARLGQSWRIAGTNQRPGGDGAFCLGQAADVYCGQIVLVIGPLPRGSVEVWLTARWLEQTGNKLTAGPKLKLLADVMLSVSIARDWRILLERQTERFVLNSARLGGESHKGVSQFISALN